MQVIKKRIFLKGVEQASFESVALSELEGPVFAVYAGEENEYAPLKAVAKHVKDLKKNKKGPQITYVGGWYNQSWQDAQYVEDMANLPSKEELISKLLYMFKHPVQGFTIALDKVSK